LCLEVGMSGLLLGDGAEGSQIDLVAKGLLELLHGHLRTHARRDQGLDVTHLLVKLLLQIIRLLGLLRAELVNDRLNLGHIWLGL
jgi:hypothetical protein